MSRQSTLTDFATGDIFVAATLLNDPEDDHAGDRRIIQYDAEFNEKGVWWTEQPGHLIGGLNFDADGGLWAFDSQEFQVFRIGDGGAALPVPDFPKRAFSSVNFGSDGSLYLGEHVRGDEITVELGTVIPKMPGSDRYGDGHIFRFDADGQLLNEYATETHGGMAGFLGVTMAALAPDERSIVYTTETSPRLMRYDIVNDKQMPDVLRYPDGQREMFFGMAFNGKGELMVTRGNRIDVLDDEAKVARSYPLAGFGWACITACASDDYVLTSNFFSGEVAKVDTNTGEIVAKVNVGVERSVAGIAER